MNARFAGLLRERIQHTSSMKMIELSSSFGQDILHYHLHICPCFGGTVRRAIGDFVRGVADRHDVTEEKKAAMAAKVRQGLATL